MNYGRKVDCFLFTHSSDHCATEFSSVVIVSHVLLYMPTCNYQAVMNTLDPVACTVSCSDARI